MLTGYGNEEMTEPVDNMQEESQEFVSQRGIVDDPNAPMPSAGGRTGADVLAKALGQANVCKPAGGDTAGTTAPQGDMSYGADPGYGM